MQNFNKKAVAMNENVFKNPAGNFFGMADEKLYELCRVYGGRARLWKQKFAGLLPEVFKRRLFEKKGFGSIFEFAGKLAGMSEEQVRVVLHLDKKFEDKSILKSLLEKGEVSVHKLARVASVATAENQLFWATQAKILPKAALETLVRDEKRSVIASAAKQSSQENPNSAMGTAIQNGLLEPKTTSKSLPGQKAQFQLETDIAEELNELHRKGIDVNELLREVLQRRREKIAAKKEEIAQNIQQTSSHHVPVETRKLMKEEFGEKCSIETCSKPAEQIHHTQRLSLSHNHNPRFLAPLCKDHHVIAHSIDLKYHEARAYAKL